MARKIIPTYSRPDLSQMYVTHRGMIVRAMLRHGVAEHELEDRYQELFLDLHQHIDDYDPEHAQGASVETWLLRIRLRAVLSAARSRTGARSAGLEVRLDALAASDDEGESSIYESIYAGVTDESDDPLHQAQISEFCESLEDSLDDRERVIVSRLGPDGLDLSRIPAFAQREICDDLGVSRAQLERIMTPLRQKVRAMIRDHFEEAPAAMAAAVRTAPSVTREEPQHEEPAVDTAAVQRAVAEAVPPAVYFAQRVQGELFDRPIAAVEAPRRRRSPRRARAPLPVVQQYSLELTALAA